MQHTLRTRQLCAVTSGEGCKHLPPWLQTPASLCPPGVQRRILRLNLDSAEHSVMNSYGHTSQKQMQRFQILAIPTPKNKT